VTEAEGGGTAERPPANAWSHPHNGTDTGALGATAIRWFEYSSNTPVHVYSCANGQVVVSASPTRQCRMKAASMHSWTMWCNVGQASVSPWRRTYTAIYGYQFVLDMSQASDQCTSVDMPRCETRGPSREHDMNGEALDGYKASLETIQCPGAFWFMRDNCHVCGPVGNKQVPGRPWHVFSETVDCRRVAFVCHRARPFWCWRSSFRASARDVSPTNP